MAFVPFTETDRPTMAAFNEKFAEAIAAAVGEADAAVMKMRTGSYTGTGTTSIVLDIGSDPALLIITSNTYNSNLIATPNQGSAYLFPVPNTSASAMDKATLVWSDTKVTISGSDATEAMNVSGRVYAYTALFKGGI